VVCACVGVCVCVRHPYLVGCADLSVSVCARLRGRAGLFVCACLKRLGMSHRIAQQEDPDMGPGSESVLSHHVHTRETYTCTHNGRISDTYTYLKQGQIYVIFDESVRCLKLSDRIIFICSNTYRSASGVRSCARPTCLAENHTYTL